MKPFPSVEMNSPHPPVGCPSGAAARPPGTSSPPPAAAIDLESYSDVAECWTHPWANSTVTAAQVQTLLQGDVLIIDNVVPLELCERVLAEILVLDGQDETVVSATPCNPGARQVGQLNLQI